jgi:hypothetical protein
MAGATRAGSKLGAKLGRRVGPFPLWSWIALATFALVLFYLWRRRSTTGPRAVETVSGNNQGVAEPTAQETAFGGGPNGLTPPGQGLAPDVLDALQSTFGELTASIGDLYSGVAEVRTGLDSQSAQLDTLTATVAGITLGAPSSSAPTASDPVVEHWRGDPVRWLGNRNVAAKQQIDRARLNHPEVTHSVVTGYAPPRPASVPNVSPHSRLPTAPVRQKGAPSRVRPTRKRKPTPPKPSVRGAARARPV